MGQIPGSGGSQRIARIAGLGRATELRMLGRRVPAEEAESWGLINQVAEDADGLEVMLNELIDKLTALSPLALKTIKRVLNTAYDTSLSVGHELEGQAYEKLRHTEDYKEGIAAFSEKRKPSFRDEI